MAKQTLLTFTIPLKMMRLTLVNFINIAENIITPYENEPMLNVIADAGKDNYLFIVKGPNTINDGEPVEINRSYKNTDQLTKSIEKVVDKNDETLEVLFSGEMTKYRSLFQKSKTV